MLNQFNKVQVKYYMILCKYMFIREYLQVVNFIAKLMYEMRAKGALERSKVLVPFSLFYTASRPIIQVNSFYFFDTSQYKINMHDTTLSKNRRLLSKVSFCSALIKLPTKFKYSRNWSSTI